MKFDTKLIGYINAFENFTKTEVKDCFFKDKDELVFIVRDDQLGKAIGKNGINVKKLVNKLKLKLKIIGYNDDPVGFLKNLLYPIDGCELEKSDNKIIIRPNDSKIKGRIYGRDRTNFMWLKQVFSRHFKDIELVIE